ncbi:hypothetical protein C8R44DRAFT_724736 [Mycena epipterygia]|nr:hypothetical protein C8R44DRAFT_724736 [Mycena epipterygia]
MDHFPAELEDTIIDLNHSDLATLASCGLVCRSWLPSSRYHLFSSISLNENNAASFLAISKSSLTNIPAVVREVELHFSRESLPNLISILSLLTQTKRLRLLPLRDEVAYADVVARVGSDWASRMNILHKFDSFAQVLDCICLCPQLQSLEIRGVWKEMGDLSLLSSLPKSLRTLDLTCDLDFFLSWLLTLDEIPQISDLTLRSIRVGEIPVVTNHLRILGSALESLKLTFQDYDAPVVLSRKMDLTKNKNLKNLSLEGRALGTLASLSEAVYQMHAPGVEALSIRIRNRNDAPEGRQACLTYPWAIMDNMFTGPTYQSMRSFSVDVIETSTHRDIRERDVIAYISGQMPLLRARGMLVTL